MNLNGLKQNNKVEESISLLPDQMRQALQEEHLIKVPYGQSEISQIVVSGMGGSNLGAGIIKSVFSDKIKAPISIIAGYGVPANVDENTLYIFSSYSGNTEEPLSAYKEVKKRGAKILAITSCHKNNRLANLMIKDDIPGYIFKPAFNPSEQPRLGLGYGIIGMAILIAKTGLLKINIKDLKNAIANLEISDRKLRPTRKTINNKAKQIAEKLYDKQVIIVGAEFLTGNIRALRNQFCENSKHFATYLNLPDLNHFALEGLSNPKSNQKNLIFLFIDSKLYHPRVQKRFKLTKQVIQKNGIQTISHTLSGENRLMQSFEMLQLGTWITYYLGMLNKVDPIKIPWVDWFKSELK